MPPVCKHGNCALLSLFYAARLKQLISALQLLVWNSISSELSAVQDLTSILLWDTLDTAETTFLPPAQMLASPTLMFAQAQQ